jgi:PAB1-binding protein PBP1
LRRWQPDEVAKDLSLEETNLNSGQAWNQFEANERLFGVKSDFNPDIYTTKLDRSHPLYQQREAMAEKIAREIESSGVGPNMNPHLAEERGVAWGDDSGKDEEDRFVDLSYPLLQRKVRKES